MQGGGSPWQQMQLAFEYPRDCIKPAPCIARLELLIPRLSPPLKNFLNFLSYVVIFRPRVGCGKGALSLSIMVNATCLYLCPKKTGDFLKDYGLLMRLRILPGSPFIYIERSHRKVRHSRAETAVIRRISHEKIVQYRSTPR